MFRQLIKKEILEHLMSLRFAITCALCLIVILASLFIRYLDYSQAMNDYHQESAMEKQRINALDNPMLLMAQGTSVYQRPNPLKIFVRGMDSGYDYAVQILPTDRLRPVLRGLTNPAVPLFPAIDLIAFVGLIMSLMAIVFGYDAICGEKQRGTLRLMLSYSVPRHKVLLAKWIGGYVTLVVPFLLALIAVMVAVLTQRNIALTDAHWGRLFVILCLALLYVAAIYSLTICVSCLTTRPAASVMILLSIWVFVVLAVPNLSPYVAQVFRPVANAQEVAGMCASAGQEIWERMGERLQTYDKENGFGDPWWAKIDWKDPEDAKCGRLRVQYELELWRATDLERLDAYNKIEQSYARKMDAQILLSQRIGRVSPFSCFALAATELADSGITGNRRMTRQLWDYQRRLCVYAHDELDAIELYQLEHIGRTPDWREIRLKSAPIFWYVLPTARDYAQRITADTLILAGMTVLFFMLGYIAFLRYDVR